MEVMFLQVDKLKQSVYFDVIERRNADVMQSVAIFANVKLSFSLPPSK